MPTTDGGRDAALRALTMYRDRLRKDLEAVERSIQLLGAEQGGTTEPSKHNELGYGGLGPQAAVERLLRENPDRKFKPTVAAKELLSRGVRGKKRIFGSQVAAALNRAHDKGIAHKDKLDDRWVYWLKKDPGA